jgi:heme/copper-type cytochrome/quinol oxidase subunit 4
MTAGVLSHEVFAFLALPSSAYLLYLNSRNSFLRESHTIYPILKENKYRQLVKHFLLLLPPTLAFGSVYVHRGSLQQAKGIYLSWASSFSPFLRNMEPGGSIGWLGYSTKYASDTTLHRLGINYYGIPYWLIVILASIAGVLLIVLAINNNDQRELFLMFALLQFTMMLPIFLNALDQGRWVVLCISSSFILMIESFHVGRRPAFRSFHHPFAGIPQLADRLWPLGLGLWGIPHYTWSLQGWFLTAPFTFLLYRMYFNLRTSGVPGPKQLLEGILN